MTKKLIKENLTISKIEQLAMENSLKNAIKRKDYKLIKKVYDLTPNFAENKFENKQTLSIEYYFGIKDYPKFKEVTRDFINNNLLKIFRPLSSNFPESMKVKSQSLIKP